MHVVCGIQVTTNLDFMNKIGKCPNGFILDYKIFHVYLTASTDKVEYQGRVFFE
jgi:hypothetical protein